MPGRLILCGSPIGNLGDASPRLREALSSCQIVYAEDTRRSRILLDSLGVKAPLRSYFAGNEERRSAEMAERLERGEVVGLLTDAGMPAVSDPGVSAVRAARRVGAEVGVIPGPSAVTAALALSGLPAERFVFEGFLPRRGASRRERLARLAREERTMVLFSAPGRLTSDLADLKATLGAERSVVVARELTKAFEEVWEGTLGEASRVWDDREVKGELTLVVAGAPTAPPSIEEAVAEVAALVESGMAMAQAVRSVAEDLGVRRNRLYEAVIEDAQARS